jgi:hypothetical protein
MKGFALVPAATLLLMAANAACAQDAAGAAPAAYGGAAASGQQKPKPAPKPKPPSQAKAAPQGAAAFDIIPCADAKGKIHKCIRIDPTAGEINDAAKGASYRVIYGQ